MKRLLHYQRTYLKESIFGPFFKLLEALLELSVPIVVKNIIDVGIKGADRDYIVKNFILLLAFAAVGIAFSLIAQYFSAKAAIGTTADMRNALFSHVQTLSQSDLDKLGSSTLITRLTQDMNQVQNGINLMLRLLLRSPLVVIGAVIMTAAINQRISLMIALVVAVLLVVVMGVMAASLPLYRKVQSKIDSVTGITLESLTGARVIRAFNMDQCEKDKFDTQNGELNRFQRLSGKITSVMNPATMLILNIGIIIILNYSGARVNTGELTTGEVVAIYNYIAQILIELVKFANLIFSISRFLTSTKRVDEIFDVKPSMQFPETDPDPEPSSPAMEFRKVTISYGGGEDVLSDVSFTLRHGESLGIIGGTGSGKTSLVNHMVRLYDVSSGEILIDGCDVRSYTADTLRKKFGYVMQSAHLFKGSIEENIKWGNPDADASDIINAIDIAQAKNVVDSKPDGINSHIEQNGRNLSGGQKQRLAIARALVRKPEILILDDSASALDFETDRNLRCAVMNLDYNPVTVIISQRTSSIRQCDKIIVLDGGRIAGIGTHDELLQGCEVYAEIYSSQFKEEV